MGSRFTQPGFGYCAALVALAVVACTDSPTSPDRSFNSGLHLDVVTGKPPRISNTVKYSDKGAHPVTGRSGSAAVATRALLAKDGTTLVEITTGDFDGGTALGNLAKVQNKLFDTNAQLLQVANYNHLSVGSYASYTYATLAHNANVQIQANVTGIDASRTDVVTVSTPVKLRPDPAVTALTIPDRARVGDIFVISATVTEKNKDVGARADCALYVDGAEVDRNTGIWVDAGSSVACVFAQQFTTPGTRQIRVAISNVVPSDYDDTNNEATGSIEIVQPNIPMFWNMYAYRDVYTEHTNDDVYYDQADRHWDYNWQWDYNIVRGGYSVYAWAYEPLTFPVQAINLSVQLDGALWKNVSMANVSADYAYDDGSGYGYGCVSRGDAAGEWIYLCSSHGAWGGSTSFQRYSYADAVTYVGRSYYSYYDSNGSSFSGPYYYGPFEDQYGSPQSVIPPAASTISMDLRIESGESVFTASGSLTFQESPLTYTWSYCSLPYSYNDYYTGLPWTYHYCYSGSQNGTRLLASGYGQ